MGGKWEAEVRRPLWLGGEIGGRVEQRDTLGDDTDAGKTEKKLLMTFFSPRKN
jgi:hypothetical protein